MSKEELEQKLPAGWILVKLEDVCDVKGGKRLPSGTDFAKQCTPYPYIRVVDFQDGSINDSQLKYLDKDTQRQIYRYIINKEDVFISIAGTIGVVGVIPEYLDGANLTENAARLVINDKTSLCRDYLSVFLRSPIGRDAIKLRTNTVGQPKLALERIRSISIPLPPLSEQKRIAAILTEQISAVEKARKAAEERLKSAKALPIAYLREVFDSKEVKGWPRKRLKDVVYKITDGTHQPPRFTREGVPFLFVRNIVSGKIDFNVEKYVSQETYEDLVKRCRPERGDVLYSAVGSFGVAVVVDTDQPFTFQRHIAHIKPNHEKLTPEFLAYYLNSPEGKERSDAAALGGAQRTVTLTSLSGFEVPIPPIRLQQEIVLHLYGKLKQAESVTTASEEELSAVKAIPSALLRKAFAGAI